MTNHSSQTNHPTALVIGAGLAGLASAVELTTHGFAVTVIEKNAHLGGKMNVLEEAGLLELTRSVTVSNTSRWIRMPTGEPDLKSQRILRAILGGLRKNRRL